ncbi:hypothetical protein SAMN05216353_11963 [Halobacillus alkaliphilus]|uniref:Inner membrane protein n=1 Tax=Halobacillus alkaliphilus TaxID=396056 RepID=A0A1I2NNF6_9BACI|nr:hypothetical protein [Halobacillus alkaliphilus]SFG03207.1 hypothetical protein SAMN05216353_11963 [Halobacillus alkaliphilus]
MVSTLITHVPSTTLHLLAGALIMYAFFGKKEYTTKQRALIMSLGFIVLIPDVPKFLGTTAFHSLISLPFLSLLLAIFIQKRTKAKYWYSLLATFTTFMGGALLIDWIGNGSRLFSPLSNKNYAFTLLKHELLLILLMTIVLLIVLKTSNKLILTAGLLIALSFLSLKAYGKLELQSYLRNQIQVAPIKWIEVEPHGFLGNKWEFVVMAQDKKFRGTASLLGDDVKITSRMK